MALAPNPIKDLLAGKTTAQAASLLGKKGYLLPEAANDQSALLDALRRAQGRAISGQGELASVDLDSMFLAVHPFLNEKGLLASLPSEYSQRRRETILAWLRWLNPAIWLRVLRTAQGKRSRRAHPEPPEIHRAGLALELAEAHFRAERGRAPESHESWESPFSWTTIGCHGGHYTFRGFGDFFWGVVERDGTMAVERAVQEGTREVYPGRRRSGAPEAPWDMALAHRMLEFGLMIFTAEQGHCLRDGDQKIYPLSNGEVTIRDRRIEWQGAWGRFLGSTGESGELCSVHFMSEIADP